MSKPRGEGAFRVVERDTHYYIEGLPDWRGRPDTMLLYYYPHGDVDAPYDAEKMLGALYDAWNSLDGFEGFSRVVFRTPFGTYVGESVHVYGPIETGG